MPTTAFDRPSPASLPVLVVEDDEINAKVATYMMSKRGLTSVLTGDAREAVVLVATSRFQAIFMDWHTPGLDGLSATRAIRAAEPHGERTPIIAMTAFAVADARERCLAAGMDDFLSKPVAPAELDRVIAQWLARPASCERAPLAQPFDAAAMNALRRFQVADEVDIIADVANTFLRTAPTRMKQLRAAYQLADSETFVRVAHTLKSMSATVGATKLAALCKDLEQSLSTEQGRHASDRLVEMEVELETACDFLRLELGDTTPRDTLPVGRMSL